MFIDRLMPAAMHYPCNYGYIPHTILASWNSTAADRGASAALAGVDAGRTIPAGGQGRVMACAAPG